MSLLERLKSGTGNLKTIKFPGTEDDVMLKILSNAELQAAHFAAERLFKRLEIDTSMTTIDAYEDEKTAQILFRALRDPEDPSKGMANTIDEFKKLLTRTEKEVLVDEYSSFESECSPQVTQIGEQELEQLIEEIKKNPATLGSVSNIALARRLITFLVAQAPPLQKDNGSIFS